MKYEQFVSLRKTAQLRLLKMHFESGVGHIGGNLSSLDIMLYLHHDLMKDDDVFILSKGHSVGALYITLWTKGLIEEHQLKEFHRDNTFLAGHPVPGWHESIKVATGSLGHGFPMACGIAFAKKLQKAKGRVYCLCSDGEWQEGSNWEALIFSSHQQLSNLTVIIDQNGLQGFGTTQQVASMGNLIERFRAFGLQIETGNGHDFLSLENCLKDEKSQKDPKLAVMETIKGKGVSFFENKLHSHYLPLDKQSYEQACKEIRQ